MGVYEKPYARNEFNFGVIIPGVDPTADVVLNVGDYQVELEIKGSSFRKTDGTATAVNMNVGIEQLEITPTGGVDAVINVDYLRANKDLARGDELIESVELLVDDDVTPLVIDRTGFLNIYRSGGVAEKSSFNTNLQGNGLFKYRLKRNTSYLFRLTTISGTATTAECIVFGVLRDL